jgi:plastocyanin
MTGFSRVASLTCVLVLACACAAAQDGRVEVRAHLPLLQHGKSHAVAVLWLQPLPGTATLPFPQHGRYTLLQKDRMFTPHLLVIPVGAAVHFPNADPFYHNVFSLFDGKRFDLGLYEAGSSREVVFSHEGVSYIFCNIHPEMSAVVLALSTPLYSVADNTGVFALHGVPEGDYSVEVWVEGVPQPATSNETRHVHVAQANMDLGALPVSLPQPGTLAHKNMYGQDYDTHEKPTY